MWYTMSKMGQLILYKFLGQLTKFFYFFLNQKTLYNNF